MAYPAHLQHTITNVAGSIVVTPANGSTPSAYKVSGIQAITGNFDADPNDSAQVAAGDAYRSSKYPYAAKTEVTVLFHDQTKLIIDVQGTTNQATWNLGTQGALNDAVADINAFT